MSEPREPQPGQLYVFSAPSGAGKTSLARALIERLGGIDFSVSHTTRPQRPGEEDGRDYHFVNVEAFQSLVAQGGFLEHAEVFGRHYGTSLAEVDGRLATGQDVILDIDWQGLRQVRARRPAACAVYILPPSLAALRERLGGRGRDPEAEIRRRMDQARAEMAHFDEYDYLVVNDDFDTALEELLCLVRAGRLRLAAQRRRRAETLDELGLLPGRGPGSVAGVVHDADAGSG